MNDCVFNCGLKCSALDEKKCNNCQFYKTKPDLEQGRESAIRRLLKLPYYEGKNLMDRYKSYQYSKYLSTLIRSTSKSFSKRDGRLTDSFYDKVRKKYIGE